MVQQFLRRRFF